MLLRIQDLSKVFSSRSYFEKSTVVHALSSVSLALHENEIVGIVGESGSGKSTLARLILRLIEPTSGSIMFKGIEITQAPIGSLSEFRKKVQIVFQNPIESLNPRKTVYNTLQEVLYFYGIVFSAEGCFEECARLLHQVGLDLDVLEKYPHELSLGQAQRVVIARAISTKPDILILDECLSSLDISVQAQVINVLLDLHHTLGVSYLFISHDLEVVECLADRIIVMKEGKVVEEGLYKNIFEHPKNEYTKKLIKSLLEC